MMSVENEKVEINKVSPVNWDEVPKMDLNVQNLDINRAEVNTPAEVGRPIVVYDDSDNGDEIDRGEENGVASNNLEHDTQEIGEADEGDHDHSVSDQEHGQSTQSSLSLAIWQSGNLTFKEEIGEGAENEIEKEVQQEPEAEDKAVKDNCPEDQIVPLSTNEVGKYEFPDEPINDIEVISETPNGVRVDEGEVVLPEITFEESSSSGGGLQEDVCSDPNLEVEANALIGNAGANNDDHGVADQEKLEFMSVKLRSRKWQQEKNSSNVDVLQSIADEVGAEGRDQERVKKLLSWAKNSKKIKTETMKVREKKKIDLMKQAVDPNSLTMVIEAKDVDSGAVATQSKGKKFEVRRVDSGNASFQVRKASQILPLAETVVTKEWIQSAVKLHEQEASVQVTNMTFKKAGDMHYAKISAEVAGKEKAYNWVIRVNPTDVDHNYDAKDKETFMVSELGKKIAEFVTRLKTAQGKMTVPFRPVIYADSHYAIFDDLKDYKMFRDDHGFDLEHMKVALKGLAKLHAMTYAYFNRGTDNLNNFAQTLKLMVNRHYQPSSTKEDIDAKKKELALKFEYLLEVVRSTDREGERLADAAAGKYGSGDFLYNIFKDANSSSSNFSVLCHGALTPDNVHFFYNDEQRPIDVKEWNLKIVFYSS